MLRSRVFDPPRLAPYRHTFPQQPQKRTHNMYIYFLFSTNIDWLMKPKVLSGSSGCVGFRCFLCPVHCQRSCGNTNPCRSTDCPQSCGTHPAGPQSPDSQCGRSRSCCRWRCGQAPIPSQSSSPRAPIASPLVARAKKLTTNGLSSIVVTAREQ